MEDIVDRAIQIIADQLGVAKCDVKSDSKFIDNLGADSMDEYELVMALEDEFEIEISDEEIEEIKTVQQAIDCIKLHMTEIAMIQEAYRLWIGSHDIRIKHHNSFSAYMASLRAKS